METKYKGYIVVNNDAYEIALDEPWTEELAQKAMETFKEASSMWLGLQNGDMISINSKMMANVFFLAKPIKE
jgi:hypothetical protein